MRPAGEGRLSRRDADAAQRWDGGKHGLEHWTALTPHERSFIIAVAVFDYDLTLEEAGALIGMTGAAARHRLHAWCEAKDVELFARGYRRNFYAYDPPNWVPPNLAYLKQHRRVFAPKNMQSHARRMLNA